MWISKKKFDQLKDEIVKLEERLECTSVLMNELHHELDHIKDLYPFEMGQVVYDLQLRNNKGRFTKKNPSKEYSLITEVTVDKKNYFNLVERYHNSDVFVKKADAEMRLNTVCVD